jgi:hypothetical protein
MEKYVGNCFLTHMVLLCACSFTDCAIGAGGHFCIYVVNPCLRRDGNSNALVTARDVTSAMLPTINQELHAPVQKSGAYNKQSLWP